MFLRAKTVKGLTYLQIVESHREDGRVRQRVVASLGRLDRLQKRGEIDSLIRSLEKFSEKLEMLDAARLCAEDGAPQRLVGPTMLFGPLWRRLGIDSALGECLAKREFEFPVERTVFLSVLQRLCCPGSDRQADRWNSRMRLPGLEGVQLHHFYRAMAWLGTPLPAQQQEGATPFAPRCVKDWIEERLFEHRRTLFSGLEMVFFDTTSIYFEGAGGQSLGQRGFSKDHRPDLNQMVVGIVLDSSGNPICSEMWPGNTTDVKSLVPVANRLKQRFCIDRVCIVADRGMISEKTREQIDALGWQYILGVRMRRSRDAGEIIDGLASFAEVFPERHDSKDPSPLAVQGTTINGLRWVTCRNEEQARKDAADREAILAGLKEALKHGDLSLVGNKGYRKFLSSAGKALRIDPERVAADERYDGIWMLVTNTDLPDDRIALAYKQLWRVEDIFRTMKSLFDTRPIWHKCDETIRGHVFCSFLALLLRKEIQDQLDERELDLEWADIINDLNCITEVEVNSTKRTYRVRTKAGAAAANAFRACRVALPPVASATD